MLESLICVKSESSVINLLSLFRAMPAIKISFSLIRFPEFLNLLYILADLAADV